MMGVFSHLDKTGYSIYAKEFQNIDEMLCIRGMEILNGSNEKSQPYGVSQIFQGYTLNYW